MDSKVAERLSLLMTRIGAHLDQSTAYVRDTCTKEEFESYRQVVGRVMGAIYLDIEEKIYAEHPQLRPKQLDGPYEVDPSVFEPAFYMSDRE
jgi:hypothetical protein